MKQSHLLLSLVLLCSCGSDELSNSKAENIINDCLEENPLQQTVVLKINKVRIDDDEIEKYKMLEEEGMIKLEGIELEKSNEPNSAIENNDDDPLSKWRREAEKRRREGAALHASNFDVKVTSKAQRYIDEGDGNKNFIRVNTFKYVVDEVLEVLEIPSMNSAKVKVKYESDDITPFAVLSPKDPSEFWIKDLSMKKTSNGWKYCDDY